MVFWIGIIFFDSSFHNESIKGNILLKINLWKISTLTVIVSFYNVANVISYLFNSFGSSESDLNYSRTVFIKWSFIYGSGLWMLATDRASSICIPVNLEMSHWLIPISPLNKSVCKSLSFNNYLCYNIII